MKFLFWQFALYAIAAFALGFVAAWSWFRERLREVETALERTRARVADGQDARHQLLEARTLAASASESLGVLRERFTESETVRVAAEAEVESLRSGRLKLLSEISELRAVLDATTVSRTKLSAAEHEAIRLRGLLDDADEQLRTERAAREQTLSVLKARLADVETELAILRHAPTAVRRMSVNGGSANGVSVGEPSVNGGSVNGASLNGASLNGAYANGNGQTDSAHETDEGLADAHAHAETDAVNGSTTADAPVKVYSDGAAQIVDLRDETVAVPATGD